MTSFYIILVSVMLAGAVIGYLAGAVRIVVACVKIAIAFVTVHFLFEPLARWLISFGTLQSLYAYTLSISAIVIFSFIVSALLARPLTKFIAGTHRNIFNRVVGLLIVTAMSAVACLFFIQYHSTVVMPRALSDELDQTGIALVVEERVNVVTNKLISFSEQQPVQVMAVKEMDPVKKEGVILSFSTTNYTVRPQLESDMLQLVNKERIKRGLRSLIYDSSLTKAARLHSADMLARGYFSHNTPEGIDPFQRLHKLNIHYRYAGENLALAPTLLQAHEGLMKSPGHKANILHPSYGRMGIGVLDAGIYGLMITQEFRD
ncbi:MAG TPA: CvpA family protein [Ferruginibacter sp.]|nr:CvpA family protein [Ferruginibacter sp.]